MNQKFFDLKKEKQDRIINAAMKHFYLQGFKRASTDDIVKDANISKGLLFHYFVSKKGLYQFLCDYALRYYFLEVKSVIEINRKDYFAIKKQMEFAKMQLMKTYPYLPGFLEQMKMEKDSLVFEEIRSFQEAYIDFLEEIARTCKKKVYETHIDEEKLRNIVDITLEGIYQEFMRQESSDWDVFYGTLVEYLDMLCMMAVKAPSLQQKTLDSMN